MYLQIGVLFAPYTGDVAEDGEYLRGIELFFIVTALVLSTIVATAIPKITDEFHGLDKAAWYGSVFFLTSGSRGTFLASVVVVFEAGSLLCGVAPNLDALIVGRALAGARTAGIGTGGYTIIAYVVPPAKWPTYTVTVLVILLFFRTPQAAKPVAATWEEKVLQADLLGVALIIGALVAFSLATQYGGQTRPWDSSTVVGLLVGFALLVAPFVAWERYAGERAMVVPRLMAQRHIAASSAFAFLFGGSYFLTIYYSPISFQSIGHASPILSGVDTLPLILAATVSVISAGLFVTKTGYAAPLQVASAVVATQIIGALGWGAGFQIPVIIAQGFADPHDTPAIILFFLNVGGGLLLGAAQSGFVNTIVKPLPSTAPGVDPFTVTSTGALELRSVFPADQILGILQAFLGDWRRLSTGGGQSLGAMA
ncbi:major facilitator superfamily domain-containing protein [Hypoxylon argillaceum]|nr:major facilitator superfamily domain-containing protein [Hypoxylon argillaceum]